MFQSSVVNYSGSCSKNNSISSYKPVFNTPLVRKAMGPQPIVSPQNGDLFFGHHRPPGTPIISPQSGDLFFGIPKERHQTQNMKYETKSKLSKVRTGDFRNNTYDSITTFDASHFVFDQKKGHKLKEDMLIKKKRPALLRRYNSQDSHSNFFSLSSSGTSESADSPMSTNERVIPQMSKIPDSLSSNSPSTTPNTSPESTEVRSRRPEYELRDFLERYSLPRVVKVAGEGKPLLLYKFIEDYTNVIVRPLVGKKGKEKVDPKVLYFPEMYPGWWSLITEKGSRSAVAYSSVLQLVQEQVYTFLNMQPLTAYIAKPLPEHDQISKCMNNQALLKRPQYVKCSLQPGQVFKLRAVFQHNERADVDSARSSRSRRERDLANRYAQLIDETDQEFYVPLTAKGEFFEISTSSKPKLILPGQNEKDKLRNPLFIDKDCIYKLSYILKKCSLPLKLKLMAGPVPEGFQKDFTDMYILEKKVTESILITCSLPSSADQNHEISCLGFDSNLKFSRTLLGHDSEQRLFKSTRLQTALAYSRKHSELWCKRVRTEGEWLNFERSLMLSSFTTNYFKYCDCLPGQCTSNCKNLNEFISENVTAKNDVHEKPTKFASKLFKHFKRLGSNTELNNICIEKQEMYTAAEKRKSLERYKDMSKLIEEKLGRKSANPVKKSASFMFSTKRLDMGSNSNESASKNHSGLTKSVSLDNDNTTIISDDRGVGSNCDNVSLDFRMCILENETTNLEIGKGCSLNDVATKTNAEPEYRLKCQRRQGSSLKDLTRHIEILERPDLIPNGEQAVLDTIIDNESEVRKNTENSYITDRLCSEFHVKTKVTKIIKKEVFIPPKKEFYRKESRKEGVSKSNSEHNLNQSHVSKVQSRALPLIEDLPYSSAIDALKSESVPVKTEETENIYAEICESNDEDTKYKICVCKKDSMLKVKSNNICSKCNNKISTESEYPYVKFNSNVENEKRRIEDEAIYNTLR